MASRLRQLRRLQINARQGAGEEASPASEPLIVAAVSGWGPLMPLLMAQTDFARFKCL